MKIARVVHVFHPEAVGDPFGTLELSKRQASSGETIHVYTWSRTGTRSVESPWNNLMVERMPGPNLRLPNLFTEYPYLPSLGSRITEGKFDLIHAHSHLFLPTFQAAISSKDVPLVVTVHGVWAKRGFPTDALQKAYLYTVASRIFKAASRVVCLTRSDASEVRLYGCSSSKVRIIPNAVDGELFRPGLGIRNKDEVLWVGRFVPEKGLGLLIAALKLLEAKRPVTLRLVGDGPERGQVERLAREAGLGSKVIFQGTAGRREVARFMGAASVFALTSVKEGLPKALQEAMASELPIVAPGTPAVREVISHGETGLLFRPGDPGDLAVSILAILDDHALAARLGRNARTIAMERYGWKRVLESLNNVYREARGIP